MGYKRRYTFLEILNILYFLLVLFVLGCKFGIIFDKGTSEKIFHIFYYWCSTAIFVVAIVTVLALLIKSKKIRNSDESNECAKNTMAAINIGVTSFQFLSSLFGTLSIKKIAYEWLQLTIYVSMIVIIINGLVYAYVRERIDKGLGYYNQKDIINKYIIYIIIISFLFGIIIPNLMLHFGIIKMIKAY
ncbi:MAG: hypothetical protein IJ629_06505 [Clostridia bacterium]|nr:hypothetical protein [Clostridia bacterium]